MAVYLNSLKQPFQLLRRLLSILLIAVSVPLALYVAVTIATIVTSRAAAIRYNKALVEFYLEAKDWELIHFLENTINLNDLDATYAGLFDKQLWNNYLSEPQEYWSVGYEGQRFSEFFTVRQGEFRTFILKRSEYLAKDSTPFVYRKLGGIQNLLQLQQLLLDLESQARISRESLLEGRNTDALIALRKLEQDSMRYADAINFQDDYLPYVVLAPKYQPIVYDSFLRLSVESISESSEQSPLMFETSQEILLNRTEDPLLRLLAINYVAKVLGESRDPQPEVIEKLFKVLDDARKSGTFIDNSLGHNTSAERIFQQEMFTIFTRLIEIEAGKPINQ